MELRHLRYFVAVAEELSFTRAAERLRLAQPSLTRQIRNLEDELGVRLLDRARNQVLLTEEGTRFLADARRLLALSLESVRAVQQFSRGETTELSLGYLFNFNFELLPATLKSFYKMRPGIAVNVLDLSPAAQLRALEARTIDLGFVGLRPRADNIEPSVLAWEHAGRHSVVVALPDQHALAKESIVSIRDLDPFFFVAMSKATHPGSRDWLSGLCQEAGFTPRILQEVDLESGLMTFVAEGLGVTLVREQMEKLPHQGVVFRQLAVPATVDYWIAWHRENRSKALSQYIEIVKKEAPAWHSKADPPSQIINDGFEQPVQSLSGRPGRPSFAGRDATAIPRAAVA